MISNVDEGISFRWFLACLYDFPRRPENSHTEAAKRVIY